MTSRPLLASVAESIVILAPIVQVGWRRACAGVTAARVAASASRNGPPDAVRISAATLAIDSPTSDGQTAECSESIGLSQARRLAYGSSPSTVWRPIEPVEPRSATPRGRSPAPASGDDGDDIQGHDRRSEHERIDPVEHPSVAGDQVPRVLGAGGPLDDRFGQVAGL